MEGVKRNVMQQSVLHEDETPDVEEMANLPADVRVHVLPSGEEKLPLMSMRYRNAKAVASRIQRGYQAASEYLSSLPELA